MLCSVGSYAHLIPPMWLALFFASRIVRWLAVVLGVSFARVAQLIKS